ncbi:hypothetical protein [Cellulophaga sp. L1A9]|uniref:hypothetical protein n=1 Tax=Cellulophaga sp. L1A9 TaxID=2686362 RepID=UPI00131C85BF|nr:hypothetical protein [Cellulophaga sp. L1A9]
MKQYIYIYIYIILIFLTYSCSFKSDKVLNEPTIQNTIKVYDTIKIYDTIRNYDTVVDTIEIFERVIDTIKIAKIIRLDSTHQNNNNRIPKRYYNPNSISHVKFETKYQINETSNPYYLEEDFNNDGVLDIIITIKNIESKKKGWLIIHGNSNESFKIFDGKGLKNREEICSDNSVKSWNISKSKIHYPGVEEYSGNGENGELIIDVPSIFIKTACGCGIIYWNGEEYAYFNRCG